MAKLRPETHAAALAKALGPARALQVASDRAKETSPERWGDLPVSPIFYRTREDGKPTDLKRRDLARLNAFWVAAAGVLKRTYPGLAQPEVAK